MRTSVGAGDNDWRRLLRYLGIAVAGYGVYQALKASKLTPHAVLTVAGLLVSLA
jgi:hypothetical protein